MSVDRSLQLLLHWRAEQAEMEAPPPPRASELLRRARPWWLRMPEEFDRGVARLFQTRLNLGYALEGGPARQRGATVPALLPGPDGERLGYVRVTYLSIRDDRLRLRFTLDDQTARLDATLALTFVADPSGAPLLEAAAHEAGDHEYRAECPLPPELAAEWSRLRVTDAMPFRLIVRSDVDHLPWHP